MIEIGSIYSVPPSWRRRISKRFLSWECAWPLLLGLAVSIAVCAPFFSGGRLFLLDWTIGPNSDALTTSFLGLNGGLTAGIPVSAAIEILNHLIGGTVTWLPIFIFFPVASVGAARLAGGSLWSRLAAGALYCVNPFVFNRIYVGHFPLLLGYALLPFAVHAVIRHIGSSSTRWLEASMWWTFLVALSPHFLWIFGLVMVTFSIVSVARNKQSAVSTLCRFLGVSAVVLLTSSYIWVPSLSTHSSTTSGTSSLILYHTTGDANLGLFANVIGLYGFWRTGPGPELPKQIEAGWPFLLLGILLVIAVGVVEGLRRRSRNIVNHTDHDSTSRSADEFLLNRRMLSLGLVILGVVGYFLSLGNQGPTGWCFTFLYEHVPFFDIMREPQKFLMLLALAYAVFFGWGVERVAGVGLTGAGKGAISGALVLGVVLPLAYTPNIFGGLAGQLKTSSVPISYEKADRLMGEGSGLVLALPWHLYMSYYFTDNRVINDLTPTVTSRAVISGDDVQSGGVETQSTLARSYYLQGLYEKGPLIRDFGVLIAPLGVQYVELAKTVDWTSYLWLNHQSDLKLILDTATLEVWRNEAYTGVGYGVRSVKPVASLRKLLVESTSSEFLQSAQVPVKNDIPLASENATNHGTSRAVRELSPVAYEIQSGQPGWVVVDAAYQKGWTVNGRPAYRNAEGTLLVKVGAKATMVVFSPWRQVREGYEISVTAIVLCVVLIAFRRRRESGQRSQPRGR